MGFNYLRIFSAQLIVSLIFTVIICYFGYYRKGKEITTDILVDELVVGIFSRTVGSIFSIVTLALVIPPFIMFTMFGEPELSGREVYTGAAATLGAVILLIRIAPPLYKKIREVFAEPGVPVGIWSSAD